MFSRQDELRPKVFKLSDMVKDNVRMLKRILGDDVSIVTRPFEGDDSVLADRTWIERALVNLASNAKGMRTRRGAGSSFLSGDHACNGSEMPGIMESVPAGSWAFLEVIDHGTGIDPDHQSRIFDPFCRDKRRLIRVLASGFLR
ncbi:hypothetical protein MASR2M48_27440 [Spirochaetota bacterium]